MRFHLPSSVSLDLERAGSHTQADRRTEKDSKMANLSVEKVVAAEDRTESVAHHLKTLLDLARGVSLRHILPKCSTFQCPDVLSPDDTCVSVCPSLLSFAPPA